MTETFHLYIVLQSALIVWQACLKMLIVSKVLDIRLITSK